MIDIVCKCGAREPAAGDVPGRPVLSFFFALLDLCSLTGRGWSYHRSAWWCVHCTRRRNLMKGFEGGLSSNVTDAPPPTEEKM